MGGGGGAFNSNYDSEKYKQILRETETRTSNLPFESTVNSLINDILSHYNQDSDRTNDHIAQLKGTLEDGIDGVLEMRFGGSVHKHTFVDGLSDIDILVIVNRTELRESSPKAIQQYIRDKLIETRDRDITDIKVGDIAVTVTFSDGEQIQLLPALRENDGYKIPGESSVKWSDIIRPDKFANRLSEVNQACGGKVVPVVKLAKDIIYSLPRDQQLKGYHIESLAVEIFKSYPETASKTPRSLLEYFFDTAKNLVKRPIEDKTGQSLHVDDYLGQADSSERQKISYVLDRISRRMKNADRVGSVDEWRSILGL